MKYRHLLIPLFAVLNVLVHVIVVQCSEFSRWKGGGFGMYTEPHPEAARVVWFEIQAGDHIESFRLMPADERTKQMIPLLDSRASYKFNKLNRSILGYASMPSDSRGIAVIDALLQELTSHGTDLSEIVEGGQRLYNISTQEISLNLATLTWNKRLIHAVTR